MKTEISNPLPKSLNLFKGRNKEEVWAEIKAKSKPADKEKILAEMRQKLIIKRGLI
jgi:acyl-CoA-binding protein